MGWLCSVLDELTRECLALEVDSSLTAQDIIVTLERLVERRCAPDFIRSDNGPEFIAKAVKVYGFRTLYIEPGAAWQNAYRREL